MDFVAIDFETASASRTSACSIGICEVKNNRIFKRESMLIRPEPLEFNEYNIKIHGITPDMVCNKPSFSELWGKIKPHIEGKTVVAHNASFDISVLCRTLEYYGIDFPVFDYICTVKLSQKAYPEYESHRLNAMADAFGICFSHHDACDDAYACAKILLHILKEFNANSAEELKELFNIKIGHIYPGYSLTKTKKEKRALYLKNASIVK